MVNVSCPWRAATNNDPRYSRYLQSNGSYHPIERLAPGPRQILVSSFYVFILRNIYLLVLYFTT